MYYLLNQIDLGLWNAFCKVLPSRSRMAPHDATWQCGRHNSYFRVTMYHLMPVLTSLWVPEFASWQKYANYQNRVFHSQEEIAWKAICWHTYIVMFWGNKRYILLNSLKKNISTNNLSFYCLWFWNYN